MHYKDLRMEKKDGHDAFQEEKLSEKLKHVDSATQEIFKYGRPIPGHTVSSVSIPIWYHG